MKRKIDWKGVFVENIKNIHDFRTFLELNQDKIYKNTVNASNISSQDEWMRENQWDAELAKSCSRISINCKNGTS